MCMAECDVCEHCFTQKIIWNALLWLAEHACTQKWIHVWALRGAKQSCDWRKTHTLGFLVTDLGSKCCMCVWERFDKVVCLLQHIRLSLSLQEHLNTRMQERREIQIVVSLRSNNLFRQLRGWRKTATDKPPYLFLILLPTPPHPTPSTPLPLSHLFAHWSKLNTLESN